MYLGGNEPCDIVRKDDVMVNLSNELSLKLRNIRHIPKLKKNLLFVGQLTDGGMKITFNSNVCKITKGAMMIAHDKKEGTLYMTSCSEASISVVSLELDAGVWHWRLGHMNERGMKIMLSKHKLSGLITIDLDFYEDCVYGNQRRVNLSKVRKTLKAERLELVHIDVWGKASVPSL